MDAKLQVSRSLLFWGGSLVSLQFMNGFYNAGATIFDGPNPFYSLALYWVLGAWFISDSRRHGVKWVDEYMDMGMFLYMAWFILVPIYFFKTRGWKALFTMGLLFGVSLVAYFMGASLYLLASGIY